MGVIERGPFVDPDVWRRQVALQALDAVPLKVQARGIGRFNNIKFFARARSYVSKEYAASRRINGHPVRTAQANPVKLLQRIGLTHEWVVVWNVVIGGRAIDRLTYDGMADRAAPHVHVNAPDSRK